MSEKHDSLPSVLYLHNASIDFAPQPSLAPRATSPPTRSITAPSVTSDIAPITLPTVRPHRHSLFRVSKPPRLDLRRALFKNRTRPFPPPQLWNPLNTSSRAFNPDPVASPLFSPSHSRNLSENNQQYPLLTLHQPQPAQRHPSVNPDVDSASVHSIEASSRPDDSDKRDKGKGKERQYLDQDSTPRTPSYHPSYPSLPSLPSHFSYSSHPSSTPSLGALALRPHPLRHERRAMMDAHKHLDDPNLSNTSLPASTRTNSLHQGIAKDGLARGSPINSSHFTSQGAAPASAQHDIERQPHPPASPSPSSTHSLAWNASHPCYPHPNPHVPLSSPLAASTRVIRVPRDWLAQGDVVPQFSQTYPEILAPWISEAEFRTLLAALNAELLRTFDPRAPRAWLDVALGLLTGWLSDDVGLTNTKRGVREIERIIADWNSSLRTRRQQTARPTDNATADGADAVAVIDLRRTAYMSLDFVIPDPKIKVVAGSVAPGTSRLGTRPVTRPGSAGAAEARIAAAEPSRAGLGPEAPAGAEPSRAAEAILSSESRPQRNHTEPRAELAA